MMRLKKFILRILLILMFICTLCLANMKTILVLLFLFCASGMSTAQPYHGTIFIDPDIITMEDSSAFESVRSTGRETRMVYDRRSGWVNINAYLFEVVWNDGLSTEALVNPEFGSVSAARVEAEKYGIISGLLPHCLRTDVDELWIHKGTEPFGGGNNALLIHTGQSAAYEEDGILEETLVHEASHTSLDATHATSEGWVEARELDGAYISTYAKDYPEREDIAESFLPWLAVRYRRDRISDDDYNTIIQTIPNRLQYFDDMNFDMFPVSAVTTDISMLEQQEHGPIIYPNPSEGVFILPDDQEFTHIRVWNGEGTLVLDDRTGRSRRLDLSSHPAGMYIVELVSSKGKYRVRVIKR